jgi:hypothetical protein
MGEQREVQIQIEFAPATSSSMPYQKGDHVQVTRLGDEVALTFHQFNYQVFADRAPDPQAKEGLLPTLIVGRILMDVDAFARLIKIGENLVRGGTGGAQE